MLSIATVLLHLSGCVLFRSGAIDCAAGEDCLGDTQLTETDPQDTDPVDTNPPVGDPTLGVWVVSQAEEPGIRALTRVEPGQAPVVVYKRDLELAFALEDDSQLAGVDDNGGIHDLELGTQLGQLPIGPQDITRVNGQLVVGTRTNLYRNNNGVITQISSVSFGELLLVHHDGGQGLYVVDYEEGSLRLLQGTSDGWSVLHRYDTSRVRSQDLFLGQGDAPMVCDASGKAWFIASLAADDTSPWLTPSDSLSDVLACGWDSGSQELVLLSESRGLLRVDRDGDLASEQPIEGTPISGVFP